MGGGVRGGTGESGVGLGSQGWDWGVRGGTGESEVGLVNQRTSITDCGAGFGRGEVNLPAPLPSSPPAAAGENQCGNGLVEQDEQCDCGSDDPATCTANDVCCTTNCTLRPGMQCRCSS